MLLRCSREVKRNFIAALHALLHVFVSVDMRNLCRGFTLIELLIVIAIIAILGGIAVAGMNQQLMLAHETTAIQHIKTIHTAEAQYLAQFGKYADNLGSLGPQTKNAAGPDAAGLIPEDLAGGKKSGYLFEVSATSEGYAVTAAPEKPGKSGRRSFFSNQTLVVRESWTTVSASVNSAPIA